MRYAIKCAVECYEIITKLIQIIVREKNILGKRVIANVFLLIKPLLASSFFTALSSVRWLLAYVKQIRSKKFIISETNAFKLLMSKYLHPCRVSEHTFLPILDNSLTYTIHSLKITRHIFEERNE